MADFYSMDVRSRCGLSPSQINKFIDSKVGNSENSYGVKSVMRNQGDAFLEAEAYFGINAGLIIAISALESGWGCSNYAQTSYSLMGVGAYNSDPDNTKQYGGKNVRDGLFRSLNSLKRTFMEKYNKWTINAFQTRPAYAQLNDGSPTPTWAPNVASIWASVQGTSNTGSQSGTTSSPSNATTRPRAGRMQTWYMHTIESGDTMAMLATKYKTTKAFIAKWNGIRETDTLVPGTVVRVYPIYVVVSGDSIGAIATDFGTTIKAIMDADGHIEKSGLMNPGQKIRLPDSCIQDDPPSQPVSSTQNFGDGQDARSITIPPPTVIGQAPPIDDGEYPKHRLADTPFSLRIGDCQLFLPPSDIKVAKGGNVDSIHTIRAKHGVTTKSGYAKRVLTLQLMFPDTDNINGFKVKGPNGQTYYMDGLRPLIAQFLKNPFLPIRNELINEHYKIHVVAFYDLTISTVDEFPNCLQVSLQLMECTQEPHTHYPDYYYDNLIMYPLFRWWYQQQLYDDRSKALSDTYLRSVTPGSMNGKIFFRVLDSDKIQELLDRENADQRKLAQLKIGSLTSLMTDWQIGNAILENVTVKLSKTLLPLQPEDMEIPAFQDLGGHNADFQLQFLCTSRDELESLNTLMAYLEEMSRQYRHRFVSGYLEIDNEILNMAGIYYGMISNMQSELVEGFDDAYRVIVNGRSFHPTQKNDERINGINSIVKDAKTYFAVDSSVIESKAKRLNERVYETKIEKALRSMEMYPDLELPTIDQVNVIIPVINKLRSSRGYPRLPMEKIEPSQEQMFCDPDFYFAYPDIQAVYDDMELGDMGNVIVNLTNNGTMRDSPENMRSLGIEYLFDQVMDGIDRGLVENYKDPSFLKTEKVTSSMKIELDESHTVKARPFGENWTPDNHPALDPKDMCIDMTYYNKKGRMLRAFPCYLMLFVDEGMWVDGKRLWNNYYAYHAVHEITVTKDKDNPVDLAFISLSNVYGAFDFHDKISNIDRDPTKYSKGVVGTIRQYIDDFRLTLSEKDIYERTQALEQARLKSGARVHIRMGYGSAPSQMPIVFNGHIADINEAEYDVDIVCQGDGVELISHILGFAPESNKMPQETFNFFQEVMTTRNSDFLFATTEVRTLMENQLSKYGIEHFGVVETKDNYAGDGWIWDSIQYGIHEIFTDNKAFNVYDVMKNIYWGVEEPHTGPADTVFDGERNIQLDVYNRTAWDAFQAHAAANNEFVLAVHPHGFRSTLFFGQPHWMVKYGVMDLPGSFDPNNPANYVEKVKSFQQFHMITSSFDIIANNIHASDEHISHVAVGLFLESGGTQTAATDPVYADRSIFNSYQKTMMVDTLISQDYIGPDWIVQIGRTVASRALSTFDDISDFVTAMYEAIGFNMKDLSEAERKKREKEREELRRKGHVQARDVAIGALQKKFMEMYQGEIIIFGDSAIKPWDLVSINDDYKHVSGVFQVGKVTHSLSNRTGFTTVIKPDLCVTRSDGLARTAALQMAIRLGSLLGVQTSRWILASRFARWLGKTTGAGTAWGLKNLSRAGMKGILKAGGIGAVRKVKTLSALIKPTAAKLASKSMGQLVAMGGRVVLRRFALMIVLDFVAMWIEDVIRKEGAFNNVIHIYPLWKYDKPLVAGIPGARYIIPNYIEPEYRDGDEVKIPVGGMSDPVDNSKPTGKIVAPVSSIRITSPFGMRLHPITKTMKMHNGIDIAPVLGGGDTPIRAMADGKVIESTFQKDAGNYLTLEHTIDGKRMTTRYLHLKDGSKVANGTKVKAGDRIALMGTTGSSTGVHLHFEVRNDNTPIDPKPFLTKYGISCSEV